MSGRQNVREIPANPFVQTQQRRKRLRVATYCRVSTEQEEQESSFENQVQYYTELIQSNPEWEFAGIFADRGISGTKDTIRLEFMRMIEQCKRHRIDMIYTKSLSRFSRNTLDSIKYIRMLKSLGVAIEFEKEGLNTSDAGSEIYLTWFSAFAQAESESISQNVTMGVRRGFKEGKCSFRYKNFIGYRRGADGNPEVDPEDAKVILKIFLSYLCGDTPEQIAQALERDGILSPTGRTSWSKTTVCNILQNEKYAGDVRLQKTYTVDFLEKKTRKNRGEVAQYYVTNHHPAIVTREIFQQVQLEIARRSSKAKVSCRKTKTNRGKYTSKFALSERLVCGECGAMYRRIMCKKRDGTKEYAWRCINRLEQGTRCCKNSPSLKEPQLHQAIMCCIRSIFNNKEEIVQAVQGVQRKLLLFAGEPAGLAEIQQRIDEIEVTMTSLLELAARNDAAELCEAKFKELTQEKNQLLKQLQEAQQRSDADQEKQYEIQHLMQTIDMGTVDISEFSDDLVHRIVERVTVLSKDEIEVRFVGGYSKIEKLII